MPNEPTIKPVKAWAAVWTDTTRPKLEPALVRHDRAEAQEDLDEFLNANRSYRGHVIPVLITPIEPRRSAKK